MNFSNNPRYNSVLAVLLIVAIMGSAWAIINESRGFSLTAGPVICVDSTPLVIVKRPMAISIINAGTTFRVRWGQCHTAGGPYIVKLYRADGSGTLILSATGSEQFDAGIELNLDPATTPGGNYYFTVTSADGITGIGETFVVNSTYVAPDIGDGNNGDNSNDVTAEITPPTCTYNPTSPAGTQRYCNEIFLQSQIVITHNIQYSTVAGTNLLFDLYTPPLSDTVTNRPLEIYFHGGGGTIGDGGSACSQAARLGYVCISGDFRSGNGEGFTITAQHYAVSDMDALIRFARLHAVQYGIDPNKLLLAGVSAGSMTALQSAITANDQSNQTWFPSNDNLVNRANATYPNGSPVPVWSCMAKGNSAPPSPPANSLIQPTDPPVALFLGGLDLSHGWTCGTGQTVVSLMQSLGIPSYFQCFQESGHGLGQGPTIDSITIPMAYKELIVESCPQSYSNTAPINPS